MLVKMHEEKDHKFKKNLEYDYTTTHEMRWKLISNMPNQCCLETSNTDADDKLLIVRWRSQGAWR